MPRRTGMSVGHIRDDQRPLYDDLHKGTRQPYESQWTLVRAMNGTGKHTVEFQHELGEIPISISVIRSIDQGGKFASVAPATDYTIAYENVDSKPGSGDSSVTITNETAVDYYFQVRAM